MAWESVTEQFGSEEICAIETMPEDELSKALLASDPLVALRALAELQLHEDDARLLKLLGNEQLNAHWQAFESDPEADMADLNYAMLLLMTAGK